MKTQVARIDNLHDCQIVIEFPNKKFIVERERGDDFLTVRGVVDVGEGVFATAVLRFEVTSGGTAKIWLR